MSPTPRTLLFAASILSFLAATDRPAAAEDAPTADAVWTAWGREDWDAARDLAERLVAARPDDAHAHAVLGYVLDAFGEVDEAAPHLAAGADADDVEALKLVALVHGARYANLVGTDRDYDAPAELEKATAAYARWASLAPDSAYPLQGLAWLRRSGGRTQEAVGLLYAAVATDPMADEPHGDLWRFLNTEVSYAELAAFYEGLALTAADGATRARCLSYEGQLLRFQGDKLRADANASDTSTGRVSGTTKAIASYRRAQPLFQRAAEADPTLAEAALAHEFACRVGVVDAYADLGDAAAAKKRLTETREALLERTEVGAPTFVTTIDALGYALFRLAGGEAAQFEDAEKYRRDMDDIRALWKWAVTLVDDHAEWWNNLGFFAREAQRYEESYAAYERCIELEPESVRYLNDTGLIQLYHLKGDLARAEELFRRAVALGAEQYPAVKDDPDREWEMRSAWGDAMLNLGLVLTERGEYEEAEEALDRLAALDGGRADLAQARAALAVRRGDVQGLKRTVRELLSAEAIDRSGRVLLASIGAELRRSLESAPDAELAELLAEIEAALRPARETTDGSGR